MLTENCDWLVSSIDYVEKTFFIWDHELALYRLRSGVKYKMKIHMSSDCESELIILKGLYDEEGYELVKRIVLDNKETLINAICTKTQNGDDHKSKFDILIFLFLKFDFFYREIFLNEENRKNILDKVERLLHGKKWEKLIARLYIFLIKTYSSTIPTEISAIERRYLSVANFEIKNYLPKECNS